MQVLSGAICFRRTLFVTLVTKLQGSPDSGLLMVSDTAQMDRARFSLYNQAPIKEGQWSRGAYTLRVGGEEDET